MNRNKRTKTKHLKLQDDREAQVKTQESSPLTSRNGKMQIGTNGESLNGHDSRIFGHSTPVRKKNCVTHMEESPEIDYRYSPITIPLTQDSNEVAWDWQSSTSKTSKKDMCGSNGVSTPKRTKQLQKKRNSDSPLLYKPHKRKLVKLENIESIGKFAAELQAITEQMNIMKRGDEKCSNEKVACKNETNNLLFKQDRPETEASISPKDETHKDSFSVNIVNTSFDDLFDDAINDSMIRCSQEIEAKFNNEKQKKDNIAQLFTVSEESELLVKSDENLHFVTTGNSSTENSKASRISENSLTFNRNNNSKTYSKSLSNTDFNSTKQNNKFNKDISKNSCFNNNIHNGYSTSLQSSSAELFEIPDDSFDDCLATCMESDEVLSNSIEDNNAFLEFNQNTKYSEKSYKNTSSLQTKNIIFMSASKLPDASHASKLNEYGNITKSKTNNAFDHSRNDRLRTVANGKNVMKDTGSSSGFREERKFFKTKSLSDSYFDHGQNKVVHNKVNDKISSDHAFRSSSTSNSQSKISENTNENMGKQFGNAHLQGVSASKDEKLTSVNGMHNASTLNFNRSTNQGNGSPITRHHSLSSLHTHTKDTSRGMQGTLCTPAEIERKRLEAKMRLEAKRKQQMCANPVNVIGNFARGPVKR